MSNNPQIPPKVWYLQPFELDQKTLGIKVPMYIKFKDVCLEPITSEYNRMSDSDNDEEECEERRPGCPATGAALDETDRCDEVEKKTPWFEAIELDCMPVEKVRIYWAPQTRCFIVKAKSTFLRSEVSEERMKTGIGAPLENYSSLLPQIRYNKEKNQYTLKRIIPLPEYVCAKYVSCTINEKLDQVVIKAKMPRNVEVTPEKSCPGLEEDCGIKGEEERLHRYCQPKNLLVTFEDFMKRDKNAPFVPEFKLITESAEYYFASKYIRDSLKEEKALCLPSFLKSPRFVKDENKQTWYLRILFRLNSDIFRPNDIAVTFTNDKKSKPVLSLKAERELVDEKFGFVNRVQFNRDFNLPELVDVNNFQEEYSENSGFFRVDVPLLKEKVTEFYRQMETFQKKI